MTASNFGKSAPPSEDDWCLGELDDDGFWAYRHFEGKNSSEAQQYCTQDFVQAIDMINSMPGKVFPYYFVAFAAAAEEVCRSGGFGAADAASSLLNYARSNLKRRAADVHSVIKEVMPVIDKLAASQDAIDASRDIYGSFLEVREEIVSLLGTSGQT